MIILKKLLSVMVVVALLVCFLGVGNRYDFFASLNSVLKPLSDLSTAGTKIVGTFIGSPYYSYDEELIVTRFCFHYGDYDYLKGEGYRGGRGGVAYCDFPGTSWGISEDFLYCNDPLVKDTGFRPFLLDAEGRVLYKASDCILILQLKTTYGDYLLNYQKNPSEEGWTVKASK